MDSFIARRVIRWQKWRCCVVLLLLLVPSNAPAADPAADLAVQDTTNASDRSPRLAPLGLEKLMNIDVTIATGTKTPLNKAPAIASVITAQDIEAMGATTLEEALESVPGLQVSNTGVFMAPQYLIRGISSTRNDSETLVMINGIPINSLLRGDRNTRLGVLPLKMISRIEVIRGPGSALYGADAFAGVINVITKDASDLHGSEVGGQIGSFDTYEAWFLHGEEHGGLKLTLMGDYRSTDGESRDINADAQTRLDNIFGTHASLAPGPINLSENGLALLIDLEKSNWRLRGSYYGKDHVGTGQGQTDSLDPRGKLKIDRIMLDLTYHHAKLGEDWDFTSRFSFRDEGLQTTDNRLLFPPGADLGNGVFPNGVMDYVNDRERHFKFDNLVLYTGFMDHQVRLGAGWSLDDLYEARFASNSTTTNAPLPNLIDVTNTPQNPIGTNSRHSFYGFLQDEWKLANRWDLTAGLRYDHYSDFGGTINPRVVLVWQTTPDLTTKLLYGRAFRAPTFVELFPMNNPVARGNPNLKPEILNNYEIGWDWRIAPPWRAGLNVFYYTVSDLITFVQNATLATATAQNSGNQNGYGVEVETKVKATDGLLFTGNYSFVNATDEQSGKPAGKYPNHKIYLRDDWTFVKNWSWSTQLTWVSAWDRQPTDPRPPLAGYTTVDLILRRVALFDKLDVTASVRNLFDADVRHPSNGPGPTSTAITIPNDLPQAGRSFYLELKYRF